MAGIFPRKICGFILWMAILFSFQSMTAVGYPDFVGYVNDYAQILSAPQASALNQELRDFDNRTTIELAVVTVESIGSESPQDYAVNIANYWGVGKRDKDNGIIFLVAMQSHDIWIETGAGLSEQISDRQIQEIIDGVIIPQFRAARPDQGVIDGTRSLIRHFDTAAMFSSAANASAMPPLSSYPSPSLLSPSPSSRDDIGNSGFSNFFFKFVGSVSAVILLAILLVQGTRRQLLSGKNNKRITGLRNRLNELVDKETAALDALKELKAIYAASIWKSAEYELSLVDHSQLELELSNAEKTARKGLISAVTADSQITDLEESFEKAMKNVQAPVDRLAEARRAQQECPAILAGLDAAFSQAEKDSAVDQISMATRMNLESARRNYQEALSMAAQPQDTLDWIALKEKLTAIRDAMEQVSRDALRDRAIAQEIQGQDPDEMLAKMKRILDEAEKSLEKSYEARSDLDAARAEYDRAQQYRSARMNIIDLYLINKSIDNRIEQGRERHNMAIEAARLKKIVAAKERATAVHHTGFGRSGSGGFGGGRMGGGSHGGGRSHGGGGGRHGGGKW